METIEEVTEPLVPDPITEHTVEVTGPRHAPNVVERTVTDDVGIRGGRTLHTTSHPVIMTDEPNVVVTPTARHTRTVVRPTVVTEHPQHVYEAKKTIFRAYQVTWYILALVEILLAFRFIFHLIGANPSSGFVAFIYAITGLFAAPFMNIIPSYGTGVSVVEWSTIIAALVYLILAWGIVYLFQLVKPVTPTEVADTVDNP